MKKIYIFTAVLALLTLSLNAQDGAKVIDPSIKTMKAPKFTATASYQTHQSSTTSIKAGSFSFNEVLRGIKGMSSVLRPAQGSASDAATGQSRAPLKINSDEYTVGPFEGNNFSTNGIGFPTAYGDNYQQVYVTTELDREEFIDHNGDEIVGFRFALAGNSSQTAVLYDFLAWPHSNSYFAQNRYTWSIPEYTGATPINTFDDIVITTNAGTSTNFRSITVYDQNNNVLTSWDYTGSTSTVTSGGTTYTYYVMPDGWTLSNVYLFQYGSGTSAVGYLSTNSTGSITISGDLLAGSSSVRVVVNVYSDNGTETLDVNGNTQNIPTSTSNSFTYNFSPSGTGAPMYVELAAGQWYECYLNEPIVFNVADSIAGMRMGYRYFQYPSTMTSELLYPIAVNPQSTGHDHVTYMTKQNGTATQVLTSWNYATDVQTFPSSWTVPSVGGSGSLSGSLWFSGASGGTFTIPASALQGCSTVTVKVTAGKENSNTHSISVNNSSKNLTQALVEYTWDNVNATNGITITYSDYYVNISKIEISGDAPNYQSGWWTEDFSQYGDLAVQLIFKSSLPKTATPTLSMVDNGNGTYTITATAAAPDNDAEVTLNVTGQQPVTGTGSASITITQTNEGQNVAATATAQATGKLVSNEASENYTIPALPITPTPSITYVVNGDNVVITASGQGEVTLNVTGQQPVTGNGSVSITVPRTDQNYNVTATATAQANYHQVSATATEQITVPFLQTEKPSITYTTQGETVVITATATEPDTDAEVTLTVGNGEPVTGIGSVSVTVPCGVQSSSVTATATAQVNGKAQSETETAQITIPAGDGWIEMTETYNNPTDLLSFKVKVGADTTMVMMIDQFLAPTVYNDHPSSYTYVLKEKINGEEKSSNPATVPVYKTNSTMYSLYTEDEVLADNKYDDNKLKANVLNSEIDYDVVPDNNVLYYSLYRGGKDEPTPVVDVDHRISQLQKFEDKVGDNVTYYLTENHLSGITPRYEHIGSQIVERLDQDYVTGTETDKLSYVPVIWTFGLYTARGDGKNNSYGSDIKNSYVGKVNISVEGYKNDGNNTTGQWKDPNGTTYCVYSPKITLNGFTPEDGGANDGDTYQYVPYMYRVWCTYPNAHNFTLLANPDGKVHLADAGAITAPFLIGEVTAEDTEAWNGTGEEVKIGRALESGEAQQPWSFGVPVNESSSNVKFVARFYYKKIVTPGAQVNGLRGTRDNDEAAFAIAENSDDGQGIVTGINELADIVYVVSTTYVNAQGMQSDKPFDGLNIVVTRYSDGTTRTTKLVR